VHTAHATSFVRWVFSALGDEFAFPITGLRLPNFLKQQAAALQVFVERLQDERLQSFERNGSCPSARLSLRHSSRPNQVQRSNS
jgi:hypothetical protein